MDINNLKDPSKLNKTAKFTVMVIAFIGAIAAGFTLDTQDQIKQLEELQKKEAELREVFLDKKKQAVNLPAYKEQLKEIEIAFGTLLRQLPNKAEMDALLNDVNQAGVGKGLSFDLFRPTKVETVTEFYAEQPVAVTLTGTFNELGQFAEDISKLPRIVNMDEIAIKTKNSTDKILQGEAPLLVMDATVRTYRYLDEKEIAARKAAPNRRGAAAKPAAKPAAK